MRVTWRTFKDYLQEDGITTFAGKIKPAHIELDLYPKIEALSAGKKLDKTAPTAQRYQGKFAKATMDGII